MLTYALTDTVTGEMTDIMDENWDPYGCCVDCYDSMVLSLLDLLVQKYKY